MHSLASLFNYKSPPNRLRSTAWLDGLRGIAALEVVIYHYSERWGDIDVGYGSGGDDTRTLLRLPFVRALYDSGAAMVCLFFIISGLVLTQRVVTALHKHDLNSAYSFLSSSVFRRGLRLFPPAVVSSGIAFLLFRLFHIRPYGAEAEAVPYYESFFTQLYYWAMESVRFVNPFESNLRDAWLFSNGKLTFLGHRYANVTWTIPVEYYGSMACYLQLLATARLSARYRNILLAFISIWALLVARWVLFCFNAGILLGDWLLQQSLYPRKDQSFATSMMWSLMLIVGIWVAGSPDRGPVGPGENKSLGFQTIWLLVPESYLAVNFSYTIWSIAGVIIIVSSSQLSGVRQILENGLCQYLGRISFAAYLLHIIVEDSIGSQLQTILLNGSFHEFGEESSTVAAMEDAVHPWVTRYLLCITWFGIMIPILFIVSGMFERFIDAPLIRLSKYIEEMAINASKDAYETPIYAEMRDIENVA